MRYLRLFLLVLLLLNLAWPAGVHAAAQNQTGALQGKVQDQQTHQPVDGARVVLRNTSNTYFATTDASGSFVISGIAPGTYSVTFSRVGYKTIMQNVAIGPETTAQIMGVLPVQLYTVKGITIEEEELPSQTSYGRGQSFNTTRIAGGNNWHEILATIPGIQLNAFGQVHTRGEHQLVSFSMDGIQLPVIPESEIGYLVYPGFLSTVNVETGSYGPSMAGETGVVAQLNPIEARQTSEGEIGTYGGDLGQYGFEGYWAGRSPDSIWHYFAGLQSDHTDLRLDAPTPDQQTLNNSGTDTSGFVHISQETSIGNFELAFGREVSGFGIPNTPDSQAAGVVQSEQDANTFGTVAWSRYLSQAFKLNLGAAWLSSAQSVVNNGVFTPFVVANPVTEPNAYANNLPANPEDPGSPYLPVIYRNNSQILLNATASMAISKEELLQAGIKADFINTQNFYDIVDAGGANTLPSSHVKLSGNYPAFNGILFVAAHLHPTSKWHVDLGANLDRFDNGQGFDLEQLSPFVNAAYSLAQYRSLRFSFNHELNIPPIVPDLTGALSALPENVNAYEISYEIRRPEWIFRVGPYLKNFSDQIDGSLLLPYSSLPMFYPVNFTTSRDLGAELTASTNNKLGFNGFLSYSLSFAQSTSPGASATSLDNPLYLDHDQRNTLDFGVSYNFSKSAYASVDNQYGSGFPQDAAAIYNLDGVYPFGINGLTGRVPSFVTNLNLGWRDPKSPVQAWVEVFNLFDNRPDITFISDFTGTRFTKERSFIFNLSGRF